MLPTIVALALLAGSQDLSPALKKKIDSARAAVEKSPDDPKANLDLGKLLCFTAGNWVDGLPHLAKGADKVYAPLAEKDLAGGNPLERIDVADQWVAIAKKQKPIREACIERALTVYGEAWPLLTDEVWKGKLRERVLALQRKANPSPQLGPYPSKGWFQLNPKCNAGVDAEFVRTGRFAVKLIPPADTGPGGMAWFRTEATPCTPGQKLVASCWVLTNLTDGGNDHVALAFFDAADKAIGTSGPRALRDTPFWRKLEVQAEVPANAVRFQVGFNRMSKEGVVFVDDFSVTVEGREILTNGSFELR